MFDWENLMFFVDLWKYQSLYQAKHVDVCFILVKFDEFVALLVPSMYFWSLVQLFGAFYGAFYVTQFSVHKLKIGKFWGILKAWFFCGAKNSNNWWENTVISKTWSFSVISKKKLWICPDPHNSPNLLYACVSFFRFFSIQTHKYLGICPWIWENVRNRRF